MIELNQLTYTAIITVTIPAASRPVTVEVRLAPVDRLETFETAGDGVLQARALRDCTLSDLLQYAEQVEEAILADYAAIRLVDLAEQPEARVKITLLQETEEPLSDDWLAHAIVLTPDETRAAEGAADLPASPATAVAPESETTSDEPAPRAAETAVPPETEPEEPVVTVAPAEPVHPEREAAVQEAAVEEAAVEAAATGGAAEGTVAPPRPVRPPYPLRPAGRVAGMRREPGDPTWAAVDILIDESALRDAQAHALTSLNREVAGVLVGPHPEKQPDGRYVVHITDTIIARYTKMQGASVTYTSESWRYLNDRLAELYPDETAVMVGWYHTHPGFGIFLSGMDQFIHQNFFTQPWHVAFVLDPVAQRSGFFGWNRTHDQVKAYEFPWPPWAADSW